MAPRRTGHPADDLGSPLAGGYPPRTGPDSVAVPGPTVVPGTAGAGGYRRLLSGPTEAHVVRTDLGGAAPSGRLRGLAAFVQVSDLHVTDAQSAGRAECFDRLADDDSGVAHILGPVGTYRAQESLTTQVVEAMTARLRSIDTGPLTGLPVTFAVSTGDAADNGQANEVDASIGLLHGGATIQPDSGDLDRWEGVGSAVAYDPRYWHPDGTPAGEHVDRPRQRFGFPTVPGLLDAARAPFRSGGLGLPWHPVYGNHDALLAGAVPATPGLRRATRGRRKSTRLPAGMTNTDLLGLIGDWQRRPPELLRPLLATGWRPVGADPNRDLLTTPAWADHHHGRSARPEKSPTWYGFDAGPVRGLVLDTVNPEGGWQGSIGVEQLRWLEGELEAGSSRWLDEEGRDRHRSCEDRLFVLFSHHPLRCLINPWSSTGRLRATAEQVEAVIGRFPNVIAWVNGHTHTNAVTAHPSRAGGGWWEVTTASHVDWPQQARLLEVAEDRDHGGLVVACTVIDHSGLVDPRCGPLDEIATLAGWSRELAANDWQRREASGGGLVRGSGLVTDRNVILVSPVTVTADARIGA